MTLKRACDLFFLFACTVVLVFAYEMVMLGETVGAVVCFIAVLANIAFVRLMDPIRQRR